MTNSVLCNSLIGDMITKAPVEEKLAGYVAPISPGSLVTVSASARPPPASIATPTPSSTKREKSGKNPHTFQ